GLIDRIAIPGLSRVVRLHGPWFLNGAAVGAEEDKIFALRVRLEGEAIKRADAVTSPSKDVLEKVREYYQLSLPNAHVIANPGPQVPSDQIWRAEGANRKQLLFI